MFTSSGSTGGRGGDAKTIISPNTSFGDIILTALLNDGATVAILNSKFTVFV